jgi:hypothetical protein
MSPSGDSTSVRPTWPSHDDDVTLVCCPPRAGARVPVSPPRSQGSALSQASAAAGRGPVQWIGSRSMSRSYAQRRCSFASRAARGRGAQPLGSVGRGPPSRVAQRRHVASQGERSALWAPLDHVVSERQLVEPSAQSARAVAALVVAQRDVEEWAHGRCSMIARATRAGHGLTDACRRRVAHTFPARGALDRGVGSRAGAQWAVFSIPSEAPRRHAPWHVYRPGVDRSG